MRRLAGLLTLATILAPACARPKPPAIPAGPTPSERLAAADALVRAGCLDCLVAAYKEYDALRLEPAAADRATAGAIRAAALTSLRQRELGMVDDGYLKVARDLAALPAAPPSMAKMLDMVEALPGGLLTAGRPPISDADLEHLRQVRLNRVAWKTLLREASEQDELAAYLWASLLCGSIEERETTTEDIFAAVTTFRDAPLIAFRRATCRGVEPESLTTVRDRDPRFAEVTALLGAFAVGQRRLDEADRWLQQAYDWHPAWPRVTLTIANVAMSGEEFGRALEFYEKTLALDVSADALLGKARGLTYLARHEDAIATVDQLLEQRWNRGEGLYWRALNEVQLERNDGAWDDIEAADKLLINAEVPKLAGIVAYRRTQLDVARGKFELSRERNAADCETTFYLGVVLAEQRARERSTAMLNDSIQCLAVAERGLQDDIGKIRAASDPPDRQARQIASREKQIASGRAMTAKAREILAALNRLG